MTEEKIETKTETPTEINTDVAWKNGLARWSYPSIPYVVTPKTAEEIAELGKVADVLARELAFMKYPEFQTYINLEKIAQTFSEDPQRATNAISEHEIGHRFCPFDVITSIILQHRVKKGLEGKTLPMDINEASNLVLNLGSDMCINTNSSRKKNSDIPWLYQGICNDKGESSLWRVYGRSMELAWKEEVLPEGVKLNEKETKAAENLAELFASDYFDRSKWYNLFQRYAEIIGDFLDDPKKDKNGKGKGKGKGNRNESGKGNSGENEDVQYESGIDDISQNIPKEIDDKTGAELAKRLSQIGSDGLPTNPEALEEFKDIMAGFGQGNPLRASISFYEMLSRSYDVMFATKPFGRPRQNPFQPVKWQPSMGAERLDVDYSVAMGGKIIPGVTTYMWNSRKREIHGGLEEVVPNLDLYLDTSMSMPNPNEIISLPVLASVVAAKKAHKKGSQIRTTVFSGNRQYKTQDWTNELNPHYENLMNFFNGGTVFPVEKMLEDGDPKQVLIVTDTFLGNEDATANAIRELRKRNSGNRITIYAIHPVDRADYLREAGAEVIQGTGTEIFKRIIGKAQEVYRK
jgi:hypothetical protein